MTKIIQKQNLTFDDIGIRPKYSDIATRTECDTTTILGRYNKFTLKTPIISAPMDTVTGIDMAVEMSLWGALGCIHRFMSLEDTQYIASRFNKEFFNKYGACRYDNSYKVDELGYIPLTSFAIGTNDVEFDRLSIIVDNNHKIICIDTANGYNKKVKDYIKRIRDKYSDSIHLMIGNIATKEAAEEINNWEIDSVRVGIGGGCFLPDTKIKTSKQTKPIADINIGEYVLTHKGNYKKVVNKFIFNKDEEIYSINGIECTANHEFYVVLAENANIINKDNIHDYAFWLEASELDLDKHLLIEL